MDESPIDRFEREKREYIDRMAGDSRMQELSRQWFVTSCEYRYSYNFTWLGVPIIQYPQDIIVMQELIWRVRPDAVVETGVAHGGSLIFYSSLLQLLGDGGKVIGIDVEIRAHNRERILAHPLARSIQMIEGSSTDPGVVSQANAAVSSCKRVLLVLDSNHTHEHVLAELRAYSSLVRKGSYIAVFDTIIEDFPEIVAPGRPWRRGDNPKTAVAEFLRENDRFELDSEPERKTMITANSGGFLRCVRDP